MSRAETEVVLGTALMTAALCGLVWLLAAVWVQMDEQRARAEVAVLRADVAAWQIGQLLQEARDITGQAARERKELPS